MSNRTLHTLGQRARRGEGEVDQALNRLQLVMESYVVAQEPLHPHKLARPDPLHQM